MKKKLFPRPMIGIDLGATKIHTLALDETGNVVGAGKMSAGGEKGAAEVFSRIAETVNTALKSAGISRKKIGAAGIGVPSPVDQKTGTALFSPNLNWRNVPVKKELEKRLDMPVHPDNDVNLGTLGEFALGACRGAENVAGFFVGTGIGGGLILNGKLVHGKNMTGGELGHLIVLADGPLCGCGNRGCLEALASRIAITRDLKAAMSKGIPTILSKMAGTRTDRIKSGVLKRAYNAGDELTVTVLNRAAWHLGIAVANVVNTVGPDMVVIGGGVFEALGNKLLPIVKKSAAHHYFGPAGKGVKLVIAQLGDDAVALGAAVFAAQKL